MITVPAPAADADDLRDVPTVEHWFTADWLLDDEETFEWRGRPFGTISGYRASLVRLLNDVARRQDAIWVLGNVLRDPANVNDVLRPFLAAVRGRVRLVAGPLDSCFHGYGENARDRHQLQREVARYQAAGITSVLIGSRVHRVGFGMIAQVLAPRVDGRRRVVDVELSSLPTYARPSTPARLNNYRPRPLSGVDRRPVTRRWVVSNGEGDTWLTWGRNVNVSVDGWGYQPVHDEALARLLTAQENAHGAALDDDSVRLHYGDCDVDVSPPDRIFRRRIV